MLKFIKQLFFIYSDGTPIGKMKAMLWVQRITIAMFLYGAYVIANKVF